VATARFNALVEKCGRPQVHLSWTTPAKDKVLREAAASNRLLTVQQESRGGKKDHGEIGLHAGKLVQYLIFQKSLRSFLGRKIIGIDYEALAGQTKISAPAPRKSTDLPRRTLPPANKPAKKLRKKPAKSGGRHWREEVSGAMALIRAGQVRGGLDRLENLLEAQPRE
jgi:hypothetical protein